MGGLRTEVDAARSGLESKLQSGLKDVSGRVKTSHFLLATPFFLELLSKMF